jgi:hypothetical protein
MSQRHSGNEELGMISMLFNREKGEAYGLGEAAHARDEHGHRFGGEARHEGAIGLPHEWWTPS